MTEKPHIQHLVIDLSRNPITAWLVLAFSLVITFAAFFISNYAIKQRGQDRFDFSAEEITQAIKDRLYVYEQTLWGVVALKNASENVNREEFARYVDTLNINQNWPGIQGIGYAIPIAPDQLEQHQQQIRAEGYPEYEVNPVGIRDEYTAIVYLEPFDWRNQRAFGYDMWSNDMRREAMARARDQGEAATSGIITLVQETDEDIQRGFLTYLPVYSSHNIPATLEQRRAQFLGWVYSPFRAGNLMEGILRTHTNEIDFEIYDGNTIDSASLLYDSNETIEGPTQSTNQYSKTMEVVLQGRPWTIYYSTPKKFTIPGSSQPYYIAIAGFVIHVFIFALIYWLYLLNKKLERLGQEWLQIIEQAPNALITAKSDGTIAMTNARADELFGYARNELVGQSVDLLLPENLRHLHANHRHEFLRAPVARGMGVGRDLRGRRKDGSEIPIEIGLSPLATQEGNFVAASIVDISERLKSQEKLHLINKQLQQKNLEMEQFIYTVSHDLKAPLVTIGGFATNLKKSLTNKLDEKQSHQLQRIMSNVIHMESLLNDLLHLSRVIREDIEKSVIDSEQLLHSVLNSLESVINKSSAKVTLVQPFADLYGNSGMIFQCVQNLISNAIQYKHPDRTPEITLKIELINDAICLSVADNGIGIESKYFERIFQIFERLDVGDGTGVGLAIVKTVVEKHKGTIELESEPNKGSIFKLFFPQKP